MVNYLWKMLPFLILFFPVCFGNDVTGLFDPDLNKATEMKAILLSACPNDSTIDKLEEFVREINKNIERLINETVSDGFTYLENMEQDQISHILKSFNYTSCLNSNLTCLFHKSFVIELSLLEFQLREALSELNDKVYELRKSTAVEKNLSELACHLTENADGCVNQTWSGIRCESFSQPMVFHSTGHILDPTWNEDSSTIPKTLPVPRQLLPTECSQGVFKCADGQCISLYDVCGSKLYCNDYSDYSGSCYHECAGVRCRNLNCITEKQICDGVDDCGDGTDEANCYTYTTDDCNIHGETFLCSSRKQCVHLTQVCDGVEDCNDGSEEGGNCSNLSNCSRCKEFGGSCLLSPRGAVCLRKCPGGFVLELKTGVCRLKKPSLKASYIYDDYSFIGTINKLILLERHFIRGFTLLKNHHYYAMKKILVDDLKNCTRDNDISLDNPLIV